jgi:hypothetical protein
MKKLLFILIAAVLSLVQAQTAQAQLRTPAASPAAELKTAVGLTEVVVNYARPSMKGRTIFAADGLVPFGQVWRTGANQATKISFGEDVALGGQELKKGAYAVLSKPGADNWEIMLYPYESGNWGSYVEKTPAATISAKPTKTAHKVETFTIDVANIGNESASIDIAWENTLVSIPLKAHTEKQVRAGFDRMMQGPTVGEYYAMGNYLFESGKDLDKALEYVRKATHGDNPGFWQVTLEAKILGAMGKYPEAVKVAEKAKDMAAKANNSDYVRMNEQAIAQWSKMK